MDHRGDYGNRVSDLDSSRLWYTKAKVCHKWTTKRLSQTRSVGGESSGRCAGVRLGGSVLNLLPRADHRVRFGIGIISLAIGVGVEPIHGCDVVALSIDQHALHLVVATFVT
jgi:hypothetical protein